MHLAAARPLVLHPGDARALFDGVLGAWLVAEAVARRLARRRPDDTGPASTPRAGRAARANPPDVTLGAVIAGVGGGFVLAEAVARSHVAPLPGGGWWPVAAGLVIAVIGVAFRLWAIVTLGRFFRVVVVIQPGHRVVDPGPYPWVRHPSYTGLLVAAFGVSLALDDWAALACAVLLSLAGLLVRIRTEERALLRALGPQYAQYQARTRRLVPRVW